MEEGSFLDLWGADLAALPGVDRLLLPVAAEALPESNIPSPTEAGPAAPAVVAYPRRILPHQLAGQADVVRSGLHESGSEQPAAHDGADPLAYGTWWHLTMEFLPWGGSPAAFAPCLEQAVQQARLEGFGERAARELQLLSGTEAWRSLHASRWQVQTEVSLVAPLRPGEWVDGVVDLVAHDPAARELLVVDWKTNQLRPGEVPGQLLARLRGEYEAQLEAYRTCLAPFFPGQAVRLALYATTLGEWVCW